VSYSLPDVSTIDGFQTVAIRSADGRAEARFVPEANMLGCSLRHGEDELLDHGQGVRAYAERGKTMGIPLLHPWANRLAAPEYSVAGRKVRLPEPQGRFALDPNGLPIHGALPRLLRWEVDEQRGADRIRARLDWSSEALLELFPFVHELTLDAKVDEGALTLATTLRATGEDAVPVSFGYHPYLTLPGSHRQDWQVRLGASRRQVLDAQMIPTGTSEPIGERSFKLDDRSLDDGLEGLDDPPGFEVSAAGRGLAVTFDEGYSHGQVYAPPGHDFICFEPMTAPANALRSGDGLTLVSPGHEHRAAFTIAVTNTARESPWT
jgi:aldose 1-epimerase